MLFHTPVFALFLLVVFGLHCWLIRQNYRAQNLLLILASFLFYAAWDIRFVILLMASTLLNYWGADLLHKQKKQNTAKIILWFFVATNLSILGFFKYFNFFVQSFQQVADSFHIDVSFPLWQIILPVGISFYTFHGLSYLLDVYHKRIQPVNDMAAYALFVNFFPLLVAGPIERATHLLPQLQKPRVFDYSQAVKGLKQILWGLIKKLVIADNCAEFANLAFNNYHNLPASNLLLGMCFFSFQIYGDFSGYTDIAIGIGRLFGIELLRNFSFPYFATGIAEFWKRWHISLTSWFRDYLYIPLGGSRGSKWQTIRNTFIVFLISGFWHGANYTFLVWGLLHFVFFLPHIWFKKIRFEPKAGNEYTWLMGIHILLTFIAVTFAWVFFRSPDMDSALGFLQSTFSNNLWFNPFTYPGFKGALLVCLLVVAFLVLEWKGKNHDFALEGIFVGKSRWVKTLLYAFLVFILFMYRKVETSEFIYFQF